MPGFVRVRIRLTWPALTALVGLMSLGLGLLALPDSPLPTRAPRPTRAAPRRVAPLAVALLPAPAPAPAPPPPPAWLPTPPTALPRLASWPALDPALLQPFAGNEEEQAWPLAQLLIGLAERLEQAGQPRAAWPFRRAALETFPRREVVEDCLSDQEEPTLAWLEERRLRWPGELELARILLRARRSRTNEWPPTGLRRLAEEVLSLDAEDSEALGVLRDCDPEAALARIEGLPSEQRDPPKVLALAYAGRQDEALALIRARLAADPASAEWLGNLCWLAPESALEPLRAARAARPDDWDLLRLELDHLAELERRDERLALVRQVGGSARSVVLLIELVQWTASRAEDEEDEERPAQARALRALVLELLQRIDRIEPLVPGSRAWEYLDVGELDPDRWLARVLESAGAHEQLDEVCDLLLGLDPHRRRVWLARLPAWSALWRRLGQTLARRPGQLEEAEEVLRMALLRLPEDLDLRADLAELQAAR